MKIDYVKLKDLILKVKDWANEKGLISKGNIVAQYNYVHLELSELYEAIKLKDKIQNSDNIKSGFYFNLQGRQWRCGSRQLMGSTTYYSPILNSFVSKGMVINLIDNEIIDGFGDTMVTLIVLGYCRGVFDLENFIPEKWIEQSWKQEGKSLQEKIQYFRYKFSKDYYADISFAEISAIAMKCGYNPVKCLECAYSEIKNRTGKIINGDFVKD